MTNFDTVDTVPIFEEGSHVAWIGPADLAVDFHLSQGHPGIVGFPDPMMVTVRWVDKEGWFNHQGIFMEEWLTAISAAEFEHRAVQLRESAWPGFPPGDY